MAAQKKRTSKPKRITSRVCADSGSKAFAESCCTKTPCEPLPAPAETITPVAAPAKSAPQPKRVTFTVRADPGSKVFVAGDFNKWSATATPLTDHARTGSFSVVLPLEPGSYEYKFVINGTWCVDPECPEWVQNSLGTLNSVCTV